MIYLVVIQPGGLFGAYLDWLVARTNAEAVGGVVAEVPILADYRTDPEVQR